MSANQKWNQFTYQDEEIPQTWFEAAVFLDRAILHLRNHLGTYGAAFYVLNEAHCAVNDAAMKEAA